MQQILWTCCVFLSSLNNTFFSVLVIIFCNKSYFCFNYMNTFFIHAMNYFSVVLRIIFPMCIKNYFLIGPRIIFHGIANLFFGLQCIEGLAFEVDWFESFDFLGWPFLSYFEKNSSYVSGVSVCIFVAFYLCNFVPLYLCIFVCSDVCARANKLRLKVLWVDA